MDRTLVNLATDLEKAAAPDGWALRALTRCADACEELEAHARLSPMTASSAPRLLVAFVQHTFTEVLPPPCAVDDADAARVAEQARMWGLLRASADGDAGRSASVDEEEARLHATRRALGTATRIAQHYTAAVFSLPRDRATSGALAVTLATILAVADMLLRHMAPTAAQRTAAATRAPSVLPAPAHGADAKRDAMRAQVVDVLSCEAREATYFLELTH